MALLTHFDIDSDFTQFFLGIFVLAMIFSVLLARIVPKKRAKTRTERVVEGRIDRTGELID